MFSFIISLFKRASYTLFAAYTLKTAFNAAIYIHNLLYKIECMSRSLEKAEKTIEQLRGQVADNRKSIYDQMMTTMDIHKQLVDQNIDAVSTTSQINDIYECLDLLDNRLLELMKSKKSRKQKREEVDASNEEEVAI